MNEVSIDLIDELNGIVSKIPIGKIEDDFEGNKLYTLFFESFNQYIESKEKDSFYIPENSVFYIFVLLSVQANDKKNSEFLKSNYFFYDKDIKERSNITNPEKFRNRMLAEIISFINVSIYVYTKCSYSKKSLMLKFLIVTALNIYEELYSKKFKIKFAYYFKKLITSNDFNNKITEYNLNSWRSEFSKYNNQVKNKINKYNIDIKLFHISNLTIAGGKIVDRYLSSKEKRYIIQIEADNKYSELSFNKRFDTIFKITFK